VKYRRGDEILNEFARCKVMKMMAFVRGNLQRPSPPGRRRQMIQTRLPQQLSGMLFEDHPEARGAPRSSEPTY
jgi:hypothetical protein